MAAAAKGKVDILCGDGVAGWDAQPEGLPVGEADLLRWPSEEDFDLVVYGSSPAALSVYGETLNGVATDACGSRHHNFHPAASSPTARFFPDPQTANHEPRTTNMV